MFQYPTTVIKHLFLSLNQTSQYSELNCMFINFNLPTNKVTDTAGEPLWLQMIETYKYNLLLHMKIWWFRFYSDLLLKLNGSENIPLVILRKTQNSKQVCVFTLHEKCRNTEFFWYFPYFPVFGLYTGKCGPERTPHLDFFHAVLLSKKAPALEQILGTSF